MTPMPNVSSRRALTLGLSLLLTASALAAPARRGTPIGDAKDDDLTPAPRALLPRAPSDVALLRGLLWAFEPTPLEIRAIAVEDLGLLGDPRALNALAQLAQDPNPRIALAAVRAVGLIRHPRAEEILTNVIRHPNLGEPLKVQAAALLAFQNTESAIRFMKIVARTTGWPPPVQSSLNRVLQDVPAGRGGLP